MKLKATIPILAGLLLLASCSNDEPIAPQQTEKTAATLSFDRELSADDAVAIAREAVMRLKYGDAAESRSATSLTPSQVRRYPAVSRSATTPGTYIVNFAKGGYAVVVADTADPQVLALNDEGIFDPDTQPGNAYFMTLADDYLSFTFDSINATPKLPGEGGETPVNPNPGLAYVWHDGHRCGREKTTRITIDQFNLITTKWHQWAPYNLYCPTRSNSDGYTRIAPCGCVPLAMAQVMAFHRKPEEYGGHTFNWNSITAQESVSLLTKDADDISFLIYKIGSIARTYYEYDGSKTNTSNIIPTFRHFGFMNVSESAYSESLILSEVQNNRPILICATDLADSGNKEDICHEWIIDGAYKRVTTIRNINLDTNKTCYTNSTYELYFHCNWGWGVFDEDDKGFYLTEVFNPTYNKHTYNYDKLHGIVYNIY